MKDHPDIVTTIINFLKSIEIDVVETRLTATTFLPGIQLKGSTVLIDPNQLKYPGDLLHEAGHIAVTEPHLRPQIGSPEMEENWPGNGDETVAILWSYAAAHHLNLDLSVVFHPDGYKNDADWLIEQFNQKNYMGLPLLEWMSLCTKEDFPKMKKWLR